MACARGTVLVAGVLVTLWTGPAVAEGSSRPVDPAPAALMGSSLALAEPTPRIVPAAERVEGDLVRDGTTADQPKKSAAAAAPARSAPDERMAALLRALYLMSAGGNARPFPTIPLD